jgi:hypothetical protein
MTFALRDVPAMIIQCDTLGVVRWHKMQMSQRVGYGYISQNFKTFHLNEVRLVLSLGFSVVHCYLRVFFGTLAAPLHCCYSMLPTFKSESI